MRRHGRRLQVPAVNIVRGRMIHLFCPIDEGLSCRVGTFRPLCMLCFGVYNSKSLSKLL